MNTSKEKKDKAKSRKFLLLTILMNYIKYVIAHTIIIVEHFQKCFNLSHLICNSFEKIVQYII